ncbi:MAG: methyltransferase [Candidatus Nanoarchaeia archaeon]|nr:methyltransferase [Candidatus Nanoarchaeia archaeon]
MVSLKKSEHSASEHYFSKEQTSELKITEIKARVRGFEVCLKLGSGTFSSKKIDEGSKLLAEKMRIGKHDAVLDLGCGTGLIGVIASKITNNRVTMTDVNERACLLAKENTIGIENAEVLCGSMYEPVKDKLFDAIILNPPQTAGKKLCLEMIEKAKEHLNKGGSLQIVARHNKGGETLAGHMKEVFGNAESIAKKGGYRVYMSVKD